MKHQKSYKKQLNKGREL